MRMGSRRLFAPARIRRKARGREARHPRRRSLLLQGLSSQGSSSHNGLRRQLCPTCPLRALCWHPTRRSGEGLVLVGVIFRTALRHFRRPAAAALYEMRPQRQLPHQVRRGAALIAAQCLCPAQRPFPFRCGAVRRWRQNQVRRGVRR
jgi:hypothetical protein